MILRLTFFEIVAFLTFFCSVNSIPIDNRLTEHPQIVCNPNEIRLTLLTEKSFNGRVYVKGRADDPACVRAVTATPPLDYPTKIEWSVSLGACGMRRQRMMNPPGMQQQITVVISFHPIFLTKVDKAYAVSCAYVENDSTVRQEIQVSMLPTLPVDASNGVLKMPTCTYSIRADSKDGEQVRYAAVGQKLFHVWWCDTDPSQGILVRNCVINGADNAQAYKAVDENGCPVDQHVMPTITYGNDLSNAYVETHAFKFADRPTLSFQCEVSVCERGNQGSSGGVNCNGISPPQCDGSNVELNRQQIDYSSLPDNPGQKYSPEPGRQQPDPQPRYDPRNPNLQQPVQDQGYGFGPKPSNQQEPETPGPGPHVQVEPAFPRYEPGPNEVPHDYNEYYEVDPDQIQPPIPDNGPAPLQYTDAPPNQRTTQRPREPIFTFGPPIQPPSGTGMAGYRVQKPPKEPVKYVASSPGAEPPFSASPWDEEPPNWQWNRKSKKNSRAVHPTTRGVPNTLPSRTQSRTVVGGHVTPQRLPRPAEQRLPSPADSQTPTPTYYSRSETEQPYESRRTLKVRETGYTARSGAFPSSYWSNGERRRKPVKSINTRNMTDYEEFGYGDLTDEEKVEADQLLLELLLERNQHLETAVDYRIVDTTSWSPLPSKHESNGFVTFPSHGKRRKRRTQPEMSALLDTLPTVDVYPAHDINVIFDPEISRVDPNGGRFCSASSSARRNCDCPTLRLGIMATSIIASITTIMSVFMLARYRTVMGKRHAFIAQQQRC